MHHQLKIDKDYYHEIDGLYLFEIRKNDRNYQVGDCITFHILHLDEELKEIKTPFKVIKMVDLAGIGLDSYVKLYLEKGDEDPSVIKWD